jgi:hypothetical protein
VLLAIVILALIGFVLLVVGAPLRAARRGMSGGEAHEKPDSTAGGAEQDDLEAAREAKYREIRDAELDFRTGKLSGEDYEAIDSQLRAEALEILDRLEVKPRDA